MGGWMQSQDDSDEAIHISRIYDLVSDFVRIYCIPAAWMVPETAPHLARHEAPAWRNEGQTNAYMTPDGSADSLRSRMAPARLRPPALTVSSVHSAACGAKPHAPGSISSAADLARPLAGQVGPRAIEGKAAGSARAQ
jgi:hypothetical protein